MTTSILNDILSLKNDPPEKTLEYLQSIGLNTFDEVAHNSQNIQEAVWKIQYIATAYSEDSPLVILRQDAKEEKEAICEYLQIPEFMREPLKNLQDKEVRTATTNYLVRFAGPLFRSLAFMKIQYDALELDITNRAFCIKKTEEKEGTSITTEVYDSKEHGKATAESARLAKSISLLEKEIRGLATYKAIDDMKEWKSKDTGNKKKVRNGSVEQQIEN